MNFGIAIENFSLFLKVIGPQDAGVEPTTADDELMLFVVCIVYWPTFLRLNFASVKMFMPTIRILHLITT
ncbi:MAG: hypothetical protein ACRD8U_12085 [Pyrinomonadaceae bacterium]